MVTQATQAPARGFSLSPEDAEEGGGLIDRVDATLKDAYIDSQCTYGGRSQIVRTAGVTVWQVDGQDEEHTEYYSVGNTFNRQGQQMFAATEDGTTPVDQGRGVMPLSANRNGINTSCNLFGFLQKVLAAENKTGWNPNVPLKANNFRGLAGMRVHLQRFPAPELQGIVPQQGQGGQDQNRQRTILAPTVIIAAPGQAAPAASVAAARPAVARPAAAAAPRAAAPVAQAANGAVGGAATATMAPPAAPAANGAGLKASLQGFINGLLANNNGAIARQQAMTEAFRWQKGDGKAYPIKDINAVLGNDAELQSMGFSLDGANNITV